MIALVSGASATLRDHAASGAFGRLIVPGAGNRVDVDLPLPWAADNGAFSHFDAEAFTRMLVRLAPHRETCLFVVCPDVVADADATAVLFEEWEPIIRRHGLPVAYVAQNGLQDDGVPWDRVDALFIGGDDQFKLGAQVARLIGEAKRRGKWVHVGRVNTLRRYRRFQALGVDSVDGTSMSRWPQIYLPRYVGEIHARPVLPMEV